MSSKDKRETGAWEGIDAFEETDEDAAENKFLMCKLGNELYGIDIGYVTDIIELRKITEVPDMPEYVRGVINLRGNVIPVMDLRLRFRMEERVYDDRTVITVVNIDGYSIGFIVDTATEVQNIPQKDIDPAPNFAEDGERNRYIAGLGKIGEQVSILLDMEKLVGREEVNSIHAAADMAQLETGTGESFEEIVEIGPRPERR